MTDNTHVNGVNENTELNTNTVNESTNKDSIDTESIKENMDVELSDMTFEDYNNMMLAESILNEVQIQFNRNRDVNFGNAVILAGGAGCFSGDTLVKTKDGDKKISDINEDDLVQTYNEETKTFEYQPVLELKEHANFGKQFVKVEFDDGSTTVCTADHEFLVDGEWVQAKDLM